MAHIVVGETEIDPNMPSHVKGVHEGNWPSGRERKLRALGKDPTTEGSPRRSTGVSPHDHAPIDPRMPRLTPP
jgi:hypothetical protein